MNQISYEDMIESGIEQIIEYNLAGLILQNGSVDESGPFLDLFHKSMKGKKYRTREINCALGGNLYTHLKRIMKYYKKRTTTNNPQLKRWLKTYFVLIDITGKFKSTKKNFYVVDLDSCLGHSE